MRVIGTAGHVDHGKSALVQALTGTHPDRLKEEREREMTIDLGFAWLTLPGGEAIGIVDVPGHIDFIENMLAGVGGIDAALLVIAADEGLMPQTHEHLAILNLLKINGGVVALTKIDLVDPEWIDLITHDIRAALRGSILHDAPIIPVSARTGVGLLDLLAALERTLEQRPPRIDRNQPRLAIDRVFSMVGFGTVVTGTLIDGSLQVGDEVTILPKNLAARVRGLQTHKTKIDRAVPGSRVAINLSGVEITDLQRGNVITRPGWLSPTLLIDAQFEHLVTSPRPITHNMVVNFFHGAAEVPAHIRLLNDQQISSGKTAWVQFALREPLAIIKGDRFIVRLPSPSITLGGGTVIDPQPGRRHRRFRSDVIARLETLAKGSPSELLLQLLETSGLITITHLIQQTSLPADAARLLLNELISAHGALLLSDTHVMAVSTWNSLKNKIMVEVNTYHQANPLKAGLPREQLKSKLALDAKVFNMIIDRAAHEGIITADGSVVRMPDFQILFTAQQQQSIEKLLAQFKAAPWNTPSVKDSEQAVGSDVLFTLIDQGYLIKLSDDVLLAAEIYQSAVEKIKAHLSATQTITVAQVRDLFGTSRKYALALMEYLDKQGITKRKGDERVLGNKS